MAEYLYEVFAGRCAVVDGADYQTCCFRNCTLVYEGGEPPRFSNCAFIDCTWLLGRVAVTQVKFLSIFNASESSELIDQLVYAIRCSMEPPTGDRATAPAAA